MTTNWATVAANSVAGLRRGDPRTKRVATLPGVANVYTPKPDKVDVCLIVAPAAAFTVANPAGVPSDGQQFELRVKSDATGRAPSWGTAYKAGAIALPATALPSSKTVRFVLEYDASLGKWVLIQADITGYA